MQSPQIKKTRSLINFLWIPLELTVLRSHTVVLHSLGSWTQRAASPDLKMFFGNILKKSNWRSESSGSGVKWAAVADNLWGFPLQLSPSCAHVGNIWCLWVSSLKSLVFCCELVLLQVRLGFVNIWGCWIISESFKTIINNTGRLCSDASRQAMDLASVNQSRSWRQVFKLSNELKVR